MKSTLTWNRPRWTWCLVDISASMGRPFWTKWCLPLMVSSWNEAWQVAFGDWTNCRLKHSDVWNVLQVLGTFFVTWQTDYLFLKSFSTINWILGPLKCWYDEVFKLWIWYPCLLNRVFDESQSFWPYFYNLEAAWVWTKLNLPWHLKWEGWGHTEDLSEPVDLSVTHCLIYQRLLLTWYVVEGRMSLTSHRDIGEFFWDL